MRSIKWRCFWWPWVTPSSPNHPIFAFFVAFRVFIVSKHRDFMFDIQFDWLIVASPRWRTTNRPWKRCGYVTWHVSNFGGPTHMSGMADATAVKFCTYRDTILSLAKGITNNLLKGRGFAHVTHYCMHNCGVRKKFPTTHGECDQQCRRRRTADYRTYGARGHTNS